MTLLECFENQIATNPEISEEVIAKVEYKRVWSGELIREGDRILYAFVIDENERMLLMSLVEREIPTLSNVFKYHEMHNETVPILKKIK